MCVGGTSGCLAPIHWTSPRKTSRERSHRLSQDPPYERLSSPSRNRFDEEMRRVALHDTMPAEAGAGESLWPAVAIAWRLNQAVWKRREPAPLSALAREGWRRRESNPRPVMFQHRRLRAYPVNLSLVDATPAGRVRHPPARNFFSPVRTRRWNGASRIWRPIGRPFRLGPSLGTT